MMERCIIVGAGDFFGMPMETSTDDSISKPMEKTTEDSTRKPMEKRPCDLLIAADAGYENLKKLGIRPDLIVGDFDSMRVRGVKGVTGPVKDLDIFSDAEKADYIHHLHDLTIDGIPAQAIDPVKNDPDLLACVRIGLERGFKEFHLIGGTGGRIDHSIANFQILGFLSRQGCRGYLYTRDQIVTAITDGRQCFGPKKSGYFSALSLTDESRGVTERGFKYIITDVTLNNHTPTGLSNEFVGTPAEISVREGTLLLIYSL